MILLTADASEFESFSLAFLQQRCPQILCIYGLLVRTKIRSRREGPWETSTFQTIVNTPLSEQQFEATIKRRAGAIKTTNGLEQLEFREK